MSLDIQIKVDPGNSAAQADKVTTALHKTEDQGAQTQKVASSLGETFKRLGQVMAEEAQRAERARQANSSLGKSFDGLAEAIRREQQMLEKLHGPMRQAEEDVQTLEMLHKRGAISTKEYVAELAKLSKTINATPNGGAVVGAAAGAGGVASSQLSAIAAGVSKLNVGQIAGGLNQGFELLNQKLQIADSRLGSVIGSTVKFGALGAQVGGPWGAALGGIAGAAVDLFSKFTEGNARLKKEQEEMAQAAEVYWASVHAAEAKKRVEEELAPAMAEHARLAREIAEREQTVATAMNSSADAFRRAADAAQAYRDKLFTLDPQAAIDLAKSNIDPTLGRTRDDDQEEAIKAKRLAVDAQLDLNAATKSYGGTMRDIAKAEEDRKRRLEDIEQILGDPKFNQAYPEAGKKLLKEYNDLWKEQHGILKDVTKAQEQLWEFRGSLYGNGYNPTVNNPYDGVDAISGGRLELSSGYIEAGDFRSNMKQRGIGDFLDGGKQSLDSLKEEFDSLAEKQKTLTENTAKWNDELNKAPEILGIIGAQLESAASSLSGALVDAANGADVSWSQWGKNILVSLEKAIAQALILQAITGSASGGRGAGIHGGYGGLLGIFGGATGLDVAMGASGLNRIPAAATGYDGIIGGSGGTDTKLAMIRASPGESIHVRTPEQRRAMAAPGGGTTIQNVFQFDKRSLLPALRSPDGKAAIVNVVRENPELFNAILSR